MMVGEIVTVAVEGSEVVKVGEIVTVAVEGSEVVKEVDKRIAAMKKKFINMIFETTFERI